ncbi:MAG: hypothetical protein MUO26_10080 [Methanotrichaceae archaeon]|nr:hypothetical protein [Methanotrichaceae archaeon]
MIRSMLSGWGIHCDVVNPKLFELQAAKEILAEINDTQLPQVEEMIRQRIVDSYLTQCRFQEKNLVAWHDIQWKR